MLTKFPTVTVERAYKNNFNVYLDSEYVNVVAYSGSLRQLADWFAPNCVIQRINAGYEPNDTELEILSRIS